MKSLKSKSFRTGGLQHMLKQLKLTGRRALLLLSLLAALISGTASWAGQTQKAGQLSKHEVKNLIANAKTAADHERLAQHFTAKADALESEAKDYDELAEQYKRNPGPEESKHPMSPRTYGGARFIADKLHKQAKEAQQLAADHLEMAKQAPK